MQKTFFKRHFFLSSPLHPKVHVTQQQMERSGTINRYMIKETSILCLDYYYHLLPKIQWNKTQNNVQLIAKNHSWITFKTTIKGKKKSVTILWERTNLKQDRNNTNLFPFRDIFFLLSAGYEQENAGLEQKLDWDATMLHLTIKQPCIFRFHKG